VYQWVGFIDPAARPANGIETNVSFTLDKELTVPVADTIQSRPGLGVQELLRLSGVSAGSGVFITPRAEQLPNRGSRVSLVDATDSLGLKRVRLDWRYTETDYVSIVRAIGVFARNVAAAGIGRVFMPEDHTNWDSRYGRPVGGFHHMGTTRMSETAAWGVVNENLRVHGTDNVYMAGSSVFSTAGWANPTINIIAFSLRLADHLAAT
jgi:choline dehydrogenase-like flavoprotein